jgi:formylglycine-generating enzyme required for sulfatase activity
MKRLYAPFLVFLVISFSFINCGDDEVTKPEDHTPVVNITNPADDASFLEGEMVTFAGTGEDHGGTGLPDSMLLWTSNQDDTVGTGTSVSSDSLSANTHVITLTGTDSEGNTDSDNITIYINSVAELISVPGTSGYLMGWAGIRPDEVPVHTVSLNSFRIGKYEVTYGLWTEVKDWADLNNYTFANSGEQGGCYDTPSPCANTTDLHPVTWINWRDCIAWCNAYSERAGLVPVYYISPAKADIYKDSSADGDISNDCVDWDADGFRLPTEAEWEYAARYVDGTNVSSGAQHSRSDIYTYIGDCVWYEGNSGSITHPAGRLLANSLGAGDMSGNVWEWCWDWYDGYPSLSQDNPLGPDSGTYRVLRGGCWFNDAAYCRTAFRGSGSPGSFTFYFSGFRVCRGGIAL